MQWLDHCGKKRATFVIRASTLKIKSQGRRIGRFESRSIQYALPCKKVKLKGGIANGIETDIGNNLFG
jgi:hypothetical protein